MVLTVLVGLCPQVVVAIGYFVCVFAFILCFIKTGTWCLDLSMLMD